MKKWKKKDGIFIGILLGIAAVLLIFTQMVQKKNGTWVVITLDGKEYGRYLLEKDQEIKVQSEAGQNCIRIKNQVVWMEEADCPDKYCVSKGKISKTNQTIVCLPHKLVVEIEAAEKESTAEVDGVAK